MDEQERRARFERAVAEAAEREEQYLQEELAHEARLKARAIAKDALADCGWYVGESRLGPVAKWSKKFGKFVFLNYSCGSYCVDMLPHCADVPADDRRTAVFYPLKQLDTELPPEETR